MDYFQLPTLRHRPNNNQQVQSHSNRPKSQNPKSTSQHLLWYSKPTCKSNTITRYTKLHPSSASFHSWGHSLGVINPNSTLRVFLQNLNGLFINSKQHLLLQDLQICHRYGAGIISLPEMNTYWDMENQVGKLSQIFRKVWLWCYKYHELQNLFSSPINQGVLWQQFVTIGSLAYYQKDQTPWD
jgi:hypothetical protein